MNTTTVVVRAAGHVHHVPVVARVLHRGRVVRVVRRAVPQGARRPVLVVLVRVLVAVQTVVQEHVPVAVLHRVLQAARDALGVQDRCDNHYVAPVNFLQIWGLV